MSANQTFRTDCPRCGHRFAPVLKARATLTKRQRQLLEYIRTYVHEFGIAPTYATMARVVGLAPSTLHEHISNLVRKGYLARTPMAQRGLVVVDDGGGI